MDFNFNQRHPGSMWPALNNFKTHKIPPNFTKFVPHLQKEIIDLQCNKEHFLRRATSESKIRAPLFQNIKYSKY